MKKALDVQLTARGPRGAWTHILIPFAAEEVFGRRGLIPVAGAINRYRFRSSLMPEGEGRHYLAVNKAMLAGAQAAAGDTVHLVLELDTAERTVAVPAELTAALAIDPSAAARFAALSHSHRKEYADWVAGAKKQETREARSLKALGRLLAGKPAR